MKDFKEFLEIFKLPPSILSAIAIVSGIVLLLPEKAIDKLYMKDFRNNFGFAISLIFLISCSMLIVLIFTWTIKKVIEKHKDRKIIKNRIKYLKNLDKIKTKIIKEFIKEEDHTIELPANNGITIELSSFGIITMAGGTQLTDYNMNLKYFLQPWVINIINKNEELKEKFM